MMSVDLHELTDIEILLDVSSPQFIDGRDFAFNFSQPAVFASAGLLLCLDEFDGEAAVAFVGSWEDEGFGWIYGE